MLRSVFLPKPADATSSRTPSSAIAWLRSWSAERRRQRLRREAFQTLLRVDANILEDIAGLRREQVEHALRMSLADDALKALRSMQRQAPEHGQVPSRSNGGGRS